jgi:hypothetical protein
MKISKKIKKSIMEAITTAAYTMLNEHCPSSKDCPPEAWLDYEREKWDLISETQSRIEKSVEAVLDQSEDTKDKYVFYVGGCER